jgi:ribosomal protein S18 acetylase RimI-like enzyme
VIIRPAEMGDVPVLEDIVARAYRVYIERIGRRPSPMDDDYGALVHSAEAEVLVAEEDASGEGVVGLIVLETAPDHVLIANVAVDPERQHAGVGRALLAQAEEFAVGRGVDQLRLYTNVTMTENQRLYRRLGYRETGRETIMGRFERIHFSKPLPSRHA